MKILVTGGTGFIGTHLIERLVKEGHQVRCLAKDRRNIELLESLGVETVIGDLNNGINFRSVLGGVEIVYHLAGITRAKQYREYHEGNYLATKNFLAMCARYRNGLKRFVFVSSQAASGPSQDGELISEDTPYHPVSHYGRSKMLAEQEVLKHRGDLPVTIVRPAAVYGPRDRDMFQYISLIRNHLQPLIGFQKKWLNLIYVEDLVKGLILAAQHPGGEGEIFYLGSDGSYSTDEIGDTIANVLHSRRIRLHIPHSVVFTIGALAEGIGKLSGKQIFFNIQKVRESVQPFWVFSIKKAKIVLGFQPRVSLREGMRRTYQWYTSQGLI